MAKQTVNIGSVANDGTGDPLRTAFDKINDNTDELYTLFGNGTTLSISGDVSVSAGAVTIANDAIDESHLNATNTAVDNYILSFDSASGGFTWVQQFTGDITGIVAGNGLTGDATSGDASLAVGAGTGITVNANDVQIADDGVDHSQLAARYTAIQDISTTSGTINLDASSYGGFNLTGNIGTATLNFQNLKTGQVVDVLFSGSDLSSAVITLADDFTTSAINKVGTLDFDTTATNHLQLVCIDDTDSDAILNYTVTTYTAQTDPSA